MSIEVLKRIDDCVENGMQQEIILDNMEILEITPELKRKLESMKYLNYLSMNDCRLSTLANFPNLPYLYRLELANNDFPVSDLRYLTGLKALENLTLSGNEISNAEELKVLASLPLIQLDLTQTQFAKKANYRDRVFQTLNDLMILDNKDQNGDELECESDEDDNGDSDYCYSNDGSYELSDEEYEREATGQVRNKRIKK